MESEAIQPTRKPIDHRGPAAIDVTGAWYFITICAEGHQPWVGSRVPRDRDGTAVGSRVPRDRPDDTPAPDDGHAGRVPLPMTFAQIAAAILSAARWYHEHGKWRISLFLVMPDHLHFIVHVPETYGCGHAGRVTLPMVAVIQQFKSYLTRTYGIRMQRDFWDTRLRNDALYAEKFRYICNNPVRKGLCATAREWPHVIAFDRETGAERAHR